ncbi:MAG: gliding motility-associated C-terminal domain-containing protein [Bacteroidia bacterium]|nr:gliding motility-associated C-terminal domain-containing protein [Bacteroidia bacterium]
MNFKGVFIFIFFAFCGKLLSQNFMQSKGNICIKNHEKLTTSSYPGLKIESLDIADFNNDGSKDAVFLSNDYSKIFISYNNATMASPTFSTSLHLVDNIYKGMEGHVLAADFNNDGRPDIAAVNSESRLYFYRNLDGYNFAKDSILTSVFGATTSVCKIYKTRHNNDNFIDIIALNNTPSPNFGFDYKVFRNTSGTIPPLSFSPSTAGFVGITNTITISNYDLLSFDPDANGLDDILIISPQNQGNVSVLANFGVTYFNTAFTYTNSNLIQNKKVKLVDIKQNGSKQIAVLASVSPSINIVYLMVPTFSSSAISGASVVSTIPIFKNVNDFEFIDFNRNGLKDLVTNIAFTGSINIQPQIAAPSISFSPISVEFTVSNHYSSLLYAADVDNYINGTTPDLISISTETPSSIIALRNYTHRDTLIAIPSKSVICPGEKIVVSNILKEYAAPYASDYSFSFTSNGSHTISINSPTLITAVTSTYNALGTSPPEFCYVQSNNLKIDSAKVASTQFESPGTICFGEQTTLGVSGSNTYTWQNIGAGATAVVTLTAPASFTIYGESVDGCKDTLYKDVYVYPKINATIISDLTPLCLNQSAVLTATGGDIYVWSNLATTPTISIVQTGSAPQTYSAIVTTTNGCSEHVYYQTQFSDKCTDVTVSTGITPNHDGKNDFFYVENIEKYPGNKVVIFNRWGKELYSKDNYNNVDKPWPPQNGDANVASGTYFYIVDLGNNAGILKGWVEILNN